jgi:hypothetical protein
MTTFFILCVSLLCYSFYALVRNECVFRERIKMIDLLAQERMYIECRTLFYSVDYQYMMNHFWVWTISKMWPAELQKLRNQK